MKMGLKFEQSNLERLKNWGKFSHFQSSKENSSIKRGWKSDTSELLWNVQLFSRSLGGYFLVHWPYYYLSPLLFLGLLLWSKELHETYHYKDLLYSVDKVQIQPLLLVEYYEQQNKKNIKWVGHLVSLCNVCSSPIFLWFNEITDFIPFHVFSSHLHS